MKKVKISVVYAVALLSLCSCAEEETVETMFAENSFYEDEYEEYTEPVTTSVFYEIPEIPDISERQRTEPPETVSRAETTAEESESTETTTVAETASDDDFVCIDVPYISQNEDYPTGCELVSTEMLLRFYGFDITAGGLIDNGYIKNRELEADSKDRDIIYCADPNKEFIGDPHTDSGYGCYAPVIFDGLKKYLEDEYFDVANLSGISLPDLCMEYIDFGEPVVVWASIDMKPTEKSKKTWIIKETGEKFNWISNEHCLVLVGYDSENYYFNDPQKGSAVAYKKETAEKRYKELGSQAITIHPW
ncbi:MAG: C39 family peptidase [Ruminococcus flavefaciens]|nr:C39 family peptidase [Ruminococcus flavefaciens]MCM1229091.1 C39 family peptidase [Ruminococcus flavefaciens]